MLFNSVIDQVLADAHFSFTIAQQQNKLSEIDEIDDYYDNTIADDERAGKYFKQLPGETKEEYDARKKIAAPWFKINVRKIVGYFYKGKTEYKWEPKNAPAPGQELDANIKTLIDEANKIWALTVERNNYNYKKLQYLINTLKYGITSVKPRYHKANYKTGQPIKIDGVNGDGVMMWTEMESSYFWLLNSPIVTDEYSGILYVYDFDNGNIFPILSDKKSNTRKRVIEIITQDEYDPDTGVQTNKGIWRAFENEFELEKSGDNEYKIFPIVIFEMIDKKSLLESIKHLCKMYNEELTTLVNILEMMGYPMLIIEGDADQNLIVGPNRAIKTNDPTGAQKVRIESPSVNEAPYTIVLEKLERLISFTIGVPLEVLHGLVEQVSGIQLKMLFSSLIQLRENLQITFGRGECDFMYKSLYLWEMKNNAPGRYTNFLKPTIIYEKNIIPTEEAIELEQDILKELKGYRSKVQNVIKYNPDIENKEQALVFISQNNPTAEQVDIITKKNELANQIGIKPKFEKKQNAANIEE